MRWRVPIALGLALLGGLILLACSGDSEAQPSQLALPEGAIASCREAALGVGDDHWRRRSATAGPFGLYGPARDFRSRLVIEHRNGALGTKLPAFVAGRRAVTVTVPERFEGRVGLDFGDLRTANKIAATNTEVRFEPCRGRARTPWPGGLLLSSRRPISLEVQVEGRQRSRVLHVGRR